jgi:hypothetical protein
VIDSSSIEVPPRAGRAKNDRLQVGKLPAPLLRHGSGRRGVRGVVRVPDENAARCRCALPTRPDANARRREDIAVGAA